MAGAYRTHTNGNQITGAVGDQLYTVLVINGDTGTPTVTDDHSGTYTSVASALFGTSTCKVWVFARDQVVSSAVTHTLTTTFAGSPNNFMQDNLAFTGLFANGASSIRSSGTQANQALGGTPAPTLNQAALATNPLLGVIGNQRNSAGMTAPSGFTLRYDDGTQNTGDTFETGIHDSTRDSGFSGTTVTWGSTSLQAFGSIILELNATDPSALKATGLGAAAAISSATLVAATIQTTGSGPALSSDYGTVFDRELSSSFDNERIFQLDPPSGTSGAITASSTPLAAASALSSATLRSTGKLSATGACAAAVSSASLRSTGKLSATSGAASALSSATLRSTGKLGATCASAAALSSATIRSTGKLSATSACAAALSSATLRSTGKLSATSAASAAISSATLVPLPAFVTATTGAAAALSSATLRSTGKLSSTTAGSAALSAATLRSTGKLSATSAGAAALSSGSLRSTGKLSETSVASGSLSSASLRSTGRLSIAAAAAAAVISSAHLTNATPASGAMTATSSAASSLSSATLRSTGKLSATSGASAAFSSATLRSTGKLSATSGAALAQSSATLRSVGKLSATSASSAALSSAALRCTGRLTATSTASFVKTSAALKSTGRLSTTVPATTTWAAGIHGVTHLGAVLAAQSAISASTSNSSDAVAAHLGARLTLSSATLRSITGALPPDEVGSLTSLVASSSVLLSFNDGTLRVTTTPSATTSTWADGVVRVLTVTGVTS